MEKSSGSRTAVPAIGVSSSSSSLNSASITIINDVGDFMKRLPAAVNFNMP